MRVGYDEAGNLFIQDITPEQFKNIYLFVQKELVKRTVTNALVIAAEYDAADDLADAMFDEYLRLKE